MLQEITCINSGNIGGIRCNCYLVRTDDGGFILIDTGIAIKRLELEQELDRAGCKPGNLKLIVLTHGDIDDIGNAAYLRERYAAKIVMHYDDAGMVERGNPGWNRKFPPDKISISRFMLKAMFARKGRVDRFKSDFYIDEGFDLLLYGFAAKVLHLPGHSQGSIGILTTAGDLFCGDLLMNVDKPALHFLIFDLTATQASLARLKSLEILTVYPGHGQPFPMDSFIEHKR